MDSVTIAAELYTSGYLSVDPARLDPEDLKDFLIGAPIDNSYQDLSFLKGVNMVDKHFEQSCPPQIIFKMIPETGQFHMRVESYVNHDYHLLHEEEVSKEIMLQRLDSIKKIFPLIDVQNNMS